MPAQDIAARHYLRPGVMTAPGPGQRSLAGLPQGVAGLAEVAHGLLMPAPDESITDEQNALFDRMAGLTSDPDATFAELSAAYADPRLHVPDRVYNAVRNRAEPVLPGGDS